MNDAKAWPPLLHILAVSPLWSWGSPAFMWTVLAEDDPVVITPAFMVPTLEDLHELCQRWREGGGQVPVDTLALTIEGSGMLPDGRVLDFRDAIVVHKDGGMSMFRHLRGSAEAVEYDPTTENLPAIDAMREVGAASWR